MTDSFKLLDTVEPGALPVINDLVFANAADRIAGVGSVTLEDRHVGKIALQEDKNEYWRVVQVTPVLKWSRVSGRDATETTTDIYVDGAVGSDTTGNGSAAYPYQTFNFLNDLPFNLDHDIHIRATAGTYSYFPEYLNLNGHGGRIYFDASGETYPVVAGPYTIDAATGVGDVGPNGASLATDISVSPDPGWSTDEHWNTFIHITSGTNAGCVAPIFKNGSDFLRTFGNDTNMFAPGDTFEIVTPPVVIEVDHDINIKSNSSYSDDNVFFFAGIKIIALKFKISYANFSYDFFTMESSVDTGVAKIRNTTCQINNWNSALDIGGLDNTKLNNLPHFGKHAFIIAADSGNPAVSFRRDMELVGDRIRVTSICCRGDITNLGSTQVSLDRTICGGILNTCANTFIISDVFVEQINFATNALDIQDGSGYVESAYIERAQAALNTKNTFGVRTRWLKGNAVLGDYAAIVGELGKIRNVSVADVTIVGQVGAYIFNFTGVGHGTWPASGVSTADGAGSFVLTT